MTQEIGTGPGLRSWGANPVNTEKATTSMSWWLTKLRLEALDVVNKELRRDPEHQLPILGHMR